MPVICRFTPASKENMIHPEPAQHKATTAPYIQANGNKKQNTFFLVLLLGLLSTITPFSIDMYLPAFPDIAKDLNTTIENVSLSVSTYFLGFALGQILYGPLLDRFGRKIPLYIGLILYIVATIGCTKCETINSLLIMRFAQALGGCVSSVAAIAMVQDFFPPEKSASVISLLVLVIGLSPLLAPSAGSFVVSSFGWHSVFILLAAITALLLVVVFFFLPQGAPPDETISLMPKPILTTFKEILFTPRFYVFALAGTFSFSGLFIYVAGSPAMFMDYFHLTAKQYGGVFALLSVGFIGGSQLNHILTRKYSNQQIFTIFLYIQVVASVLFAMGVINNWLSLAGHIVFLFVILGCTGIAYPNAAAVALAPFTKKAGSASALLGFIQIGIGGMISSAVGLLHAKGSLSTALSMALSCLMALLIYWLGGKRITNKQVSSVTE